MSQWYGNFALSSQIKGQSSYLDWNSLKSLSEKQTGKTLIRLLLQNQSDLGLPCLSRLFWKATTVQNFRTFIYHTCTLESSSIEMLFFFSLSSIFFVFNKLLIAMVFSIIRPDSPDN